MTPSPATARRAQAVDVVRALAALMVLTFHVFMYGHANPSSYHRHGFFDYLFFEFRIGLVVFFVLSGYLLYRSHVRPDGVRPVRPADYYRRRLLRIVPAYYLAIVVSIALLWPLDGTTGVRLPPPEYLPLFFVFGQNYSAHTLLTLNAPTWTLAVQAAFYVVFPLFVLAALYVARLPRRPVWLVSLGLIALGLAWNYHVYRAGLGAIARLALPAMLPYLALGMLAAHWRPGSRRVAWCLIAAGLALAIVNGVWHATAAIDVWGATLRDTVAAAGFALICAGVGYRSLGSVEWLRPLEAFGRWSYGVFLFHLPILLFLQGHGLRPANGVAAWALVVALSAGVGAFTWRCIERPLLERSHGASKFSVPEPSPGTS